MPKIFISYRRIDSEIITARIYDRLIVEFGDAAVFKDVDDIPAGADFREVLHQGVNRASVVLVIIGPQWSTISYEDGSPRLHDPNDFVRIEVENALRTQNLMVVPVMVKGAQMPNPKTLPQSLQALSYRNAVQIRNDPDFNNDIRRLILRLRELDGSRKKSSKLAPWQIIGLFSLIFMVIVGCFATFFVIRPTFGSDKTLSITQYTQTMAEAMTTEAPSQTATETPRQTATERPIPTETPILATDIPYLTIKTTLNVRSGPGIVYEVIGQLNVGDKAEILAMNSSGTWYYVLYNGSRTGWISGSPDYSDLTGNTSYVQIATAPATPYPSPTLIPTATYTVTITPGTFIPFRTLIAPKSTVASQQTTCC